MSRSSKVCRPRKLKRARVARRRSLIGLRAQSSAVRTRIVYAARFGARKWIVREEGSGTRQWIERTLAPFGLPPAKAWEIGSAEAIKSAVAASLGISICVARGSARSNRAGQIVRGASQRNRDSAAILSLASRRAPAFASCKSVRDVSGGHGLIVNFVAIEPDAPR